MTPRNCAPTPSPAYHDLNISKSLLLVDASTQISGFLAEWMFWKIFKRLFSILYERLSSFLPDRPSEVTNKSKAVFFKQFIFTA